MNKIMKSIENGTVWRTAYLALLQVRQDLEEKIQEGLNTGDCYVFLKQYNFKFKDGDFKHEIDFIIEIEGHGDNEDADWEIAINIKDKGIFIRELAEEIAEAINEEKDEEECLKRLSDKLTCIVEVIKVTKEKNLY